ncbi:hypothetical protein AB0B94_20860 [Micromonospora sp. NPDC048986]|uniref:hypothetical protein n=1 Tax=Micromonospora sp. NPDC048986 TaxID=3155644 RepID=UPI0033E80C74
MRAASPARRRAGPTGDPVLRRPVAPMLATSVDQMPEGPDLIHEPKWDGFLN